MGQRAANTAPALAVAHQGRPSPPVGQSARLVFSRLAPHSLLRTLKYPPVLRVAAECEGPAPPGALPGSSAEQMSSAPATAKLRG